MAQFRAAQYDDAINMFIDLEINPAKIIALYPENIAGRLSVPPHEWIPLFGGPKPPSPPASPPPPNEGDREETPSQTVASPRDSSPKGSVRGTVKSGVDAVKSAAAKDDDAASIRSVGSRRKPPQKGLYF